MIQDISPHVYDRTYRQDKATAGDHVLFYEKGGVLLRKQGENWSVPRFSDFTGAEEELTEKARHLFNIDGESYYLARSACPGQREEFSWCSLRDVRSVRPMEVAFAAVTGSQLARWYRSRAYCGRCGTPTEWSTLERAVVCPKCGLIEYPKICPAVIVAVTDGDRLLLTRYANRPFKGYALIAGFTEIGETLEDTVHREVMEEVGVRVKNLRYYKNQPWSFSDTLLTGFYCDLDGDPAITLDHNELCEGFWMERSELPCREGDVSLTAEMIERFRLGRENEKPENP
ncbi:MAG: NAD(+) diphosphatase [Clostridiales bacterium]|nr:NAD(+) diphosphatase [Clostridiales bacterium]